jgi:hypothetical protein
VLSEFLDGSDSQTTEKEAKKPIRFDQVPEEEEDAKEDDEQEDQEAIIIQEKT